MLHIKKLRAWMHASRIHSCFYVSTLFGTFCHSETLRLKRSRACANMHSNTLQYRLCQHLLHPLQHLFQQSPKHLHHPHHHQHPQQSQHCQFQQQRMLDSYIASHGDGNHQMWNQNNHVNIRQSAIPTTGVGVHLRLHHQFHH